MKKIAIISASLMAGLLLAASAQAQETSVNFIDEPAQYGGTPIPAGTAAGIDGATNWNSLYTQGGAFFPYGQTNSTPAVTTATYGSIGVSLSYDGNYNLNFGSLGGTPSPGNYALLGNGVGSDGGNSPDPTTLTLSGLNPSADYNLTLYIGGQSYSVTEASASLAGGATQYFLSTKFGYAWYNATSLIDNASNTDFVANAGGDGTYISNLSNYGANYLEFNGLTGASSLSVSVNELGTFGGNTGLFLSGPEGGNAVIGLTGFQITELQVPEPSTWALMLGGLCALVVFSRRRTSGV